MTCTNNRIPAASFSRGARAAFHTVHQCVLNQCPCAILPPLPKLVSAKANCTPIYLSLQTTAYPPPPFTLPTFASSWRTNLFFFCFFCLVAICSNAAATVHIINRPFMYVYHISDILFSYSRPNNVSLPPPSERGVPDRTNLCMCLVVQRHPSTSQPVYPTRLVPIPRSPSSIRLASKSMAFGGWLHCRVKSLCRLSVWEKFSNQPTAIH